MKVKYNAKIKGKFKNKDITMSIPIQIDLNELIEEEAISQAEFDGMSDVTIVEVTKLEDSTYTQLEIPFDEFEESEEIEDDLPSSSSDYVPYSPFSSNSNTAQVSEEDTEDEVEEGSSYTPYSSIVQNLTQANEAVSFVPKFQNGYVPYQRKIIPIPNSYTKHKFK